MTEPGRYPDPIRNLTKQERLEKKRLSEPYKYPNDDLIHKLKQVPFLYGRLIEEVTLGTTETEIWHSLDSTNIGWLVLSQDASATIFKVSLTFSPPVDEAEAKQQERQKKNKVLLKASAPVTVKLWIFSSYKAPAPPPLKDRPRS